MGKTLKQMPIGIDNFRELRTKKGYYVDKTLLIKEIMESISKVILFTRPRRFGKTLNFSMLKCFLEIPECRKYDHQAENYLYLFEGLAIYDEKELVKKHCGKYPVIDFSFKKIKATDWEDAGYLFMEEISREYRRHRYLLESDAIRAPGQKEKYERIMNQKGRIIEYTAAIKDLSEYLHDYYQKEAVVLMDEYDTPLHYAKLNGYYDEMLNIIRALMVDGMKGNDHLEKGIVTGIMKISQGSIFSAFNNPKIATLTNSYRADKFDFTEGEVAEMLDYYSLDSYGELVREWYNGYLFGGETVIYNPWSIISFIDNDDHRPKNFWINTGDTALIKECLRLDQLKSKEYLERFYKGEAIAMEVEQNIVYEDVQNDVDKALSYLLHDEYYLESNREYGMGRPDLVIIPKDKSKKAYLLELKNEYSFSKKPPKRPPGKPCSR